MTSCRVDGVGAAEPDEAIDAHFLVLADGRLYTTPPQHAAESLLQENKLHRKVRLRRRPVPGPLLRDALGERLVRGDLREARRDVDVAALEPICWCCYLMK